MELNSLDQDHTATAPITDRTNSRSRLIMPTGVQDRQESDAEVDGTRASHPTSVEANTSSVRSHEDPYASSIFCSISAGLLLLATATVAVASWYLAWTIRPSFYPGLVAGISMTAILVLATFGPLYEEYLRHKKHM